MRQLIMMLGIVLFTVSLYALPKDDKKKTEGEGTEVSYYKEGIAYSLPRTGIKIRVVAEKETRVAGPYAQYAQKYLSIENAPSSNTEKWEIKSISIETFAEPDPNEVYKAMGTTAALLNLTRSGLIAGINSDEQNQEEPFGTNSMVAENLVPDFPFTDLSMWGMFTKGDSLNQYRIVQKSLEEKAAEASETIYNLRNSRFRLLTNADDEPLPDGKSFEVMAKELGDMENEQLALFIGKSIKKTFHYSFDFIPGNNDVKGEVVFRFSENKGVLPKTDLSGKPVIIDITKENDLANQQKKQAGSQNPAAGESGVYYRMPGKATVTLSNGVTILATTRVTISQFGTVAPLPEDFLDGNYMIQFHPETGTVKSVLPVK
jgi:hypothetical protein